MLAFNKLTRDDFSTWKSNLMAILVLDDLRFVLAEECPQNPGSTNNWSFWKSYDKWVHANEKAKAYILASIFNVLAKKHKLKATTKAIFVASYVWPTIFYINVQGH